MSLKKKKKIPSLLSNNSHGIYKDQIFDNEIDSKYYAKNMLRFFTNNIARVFKKVCFVGFLKVQIILKIFITLKLWPKVILI